MSEGLTETVSISDMAEQMHKDLQVLKGMDDLSPTLRNMIDSPAPGAMLRELQNFGINSVDLPDTTNASPQERFTDYMVSGYNVFEQNGIPKPHLEDYYAAQAISSLTGTPMSDIMDEFDTIRPSEIAIPSTDTNEPIFSLATDDTVQASEGAKSGNIPDLEAQNYTEYDVHFMMYPLAHDILGTGIETRPSHGFIVITEKGVDPLTLREGSEEALLVTRAGPDRGTYDFRFDTDIQSATENNRDGDVYVKDHEGSANDLEHDGIRLIETTTIRGDIDSIRDNVQDFRHAVNSTDINYHAPWQNSNTYAGDVYENLTGKDAPDTIQWPHYMPGLGNDLPVEGDFSYDASF